MNSFKKLVPWIILTVLGAATIIGQTITSFSPGDIVSSNQINENFSNIKNEIALIRNQIAPVGGIVAWHKNLGGTLSLPDGWVECNGQIINDTDSPFDGMVAPNLNGDSGGANSPGVGGKYSMFLRGGTTSGTGQLDAFQDHNHRMEKDGNILEWHWSGGGASVPCCGGDQHKGNQTGTGYRAMEATGGRTASETRPVNMTVVWVMRIK